MPFNAIRRTFYTRVFHQPVLPSPTWDSPTLPAGCLPRTRCPTITCGWTRLSSATCNTFAWHCLALHLPRQTRDAPSCSMPCRHPTPPPDAPPPPPYQLIFAAATFTAFYLLLFPIVPFLFASNDRLVDMPTSLVSPTTAAIPPAAFSIYYLPSTLPAAAISPLPRPYLLHTPRCHANATVVAAARDVVGLFAERRLRGGDDPPHCLAQPFLLSPLHHYTPYTLTFLYLDLPPTRARLRLHVPPHTVLRLHHYLRLLPAYLLLRRRHRSLQQNGGTRWRCRTLLPRLPRQKRRWGVR